MQDLILKQFQQYLNAGDRDSARQLIRQYIKDHPDDADGWYLAATVAGKEQRVALLNKALAIDPFHEKAHQMLAKMQSAPTVSKVGDLRSNPNSRRNWVVIGAIFIGLLVIAGMIVSTLLKDKSLGTRNNPFREQTAGQLHDREMILSRALMVSSSSPHVMPILITVETICHIKDCDYERSNFQILSPDGTIYDVEGMTDQIGNRRILAFSLSREFLITDYLLIYSPNDKIHYFFELW